MMRFEPVGRSRAPAALLSLLLLGCGAGAGTPLSETLRLGQGECPVVAMQPDGVAWVSWIGDAETPGIRVLRIAPDGAVSGEPLRIDPPRSGFRGCPEIAVNAAGSAAVMWWQRETERVPLPGLNRPDSIRQPKIYVQRLNPDVTPDGELLRVVDRVNAGSTTYDPEPGDLAVAPDGRLSVTWQETVTFTSPVPLPTVPVPTAVRVRTLSGYHQIFGADGQALTEPLRLGTAVISATAVTVPIPLRFDGLFAERVEVMPDGHYVLLFEGEADSLWFQRFDAQGQPLESARQRVNARPETQELAEKTLAAGPDGDFDVAYLLRDPDVLAPPGDALLVQAYGADGAPRGRVYRSDTPQPGEIRTFLNLLRFEGGRRALVWRSGRGSGLATLDPRLFAQFLDADGTPLTEVFPVSEGVLASVGLSREFRLSAATDRNGNLVAVWNEGDAIHARVFAGIPAEPD